VSLGQNVVAGTSENKCGLKYVIHTTDWPVWTSCIQAFTLHWDHADMGRIPEIFVDRPDQR
jgi:hypothetical protein